MQISQGTATARATAVEPGRQANAAVGTIVNFGNYITGVSSVTNEQEASGGADEETDAALFERLSAFKKRPATSGNANSYEQLALSVAGVGAAKVYPLEEGPGTVGIVIADDDKLPVSQEIVQAVQSHIDQQKPIGVTSAQVRSVEKENINITANVSLTNAEQLSTVTEDFKTALSDHFKEIALVESEVKVNAVGAILMSIDGVLDYDSLKLNTSASNVAIAAGTVPYVGEVTLSVAD